MPGKDDTRGESALGETELWGLALLVGAIALVIWFQRQPSGGMPVRIGGAMPPLMAEGWLNLGGPSANLENPSPSPSLQGRGTLPSVESLRGKIVVVDCWATWCIPCRAAMPKLAKLYREYHPLGVEFIGLTPEREAERPTIERFLRDMSGVDWPIGYGASPTLDMLGISAIPTIVVYGPDGRAIWSGHDTHALQEMLDQSMANADLRLRIAE